MKNHKRLVSKFGGRSAHIVSRATFSLHFCLSTFENRSFSRKQNNHLQVIHDKNRKKINSLKKKNPYDQGNLELNRVLDPGVQERGLPLQMLAAHRPQMVVACIAATFAHCTNFKHKYLAIGKTMDTEKNAFPSKLTAYAVICWILAAFGGLMFGYDIGISGGVTGMDDFLIKFFPKVHERKLHATEDNYCKYDDQKLQLFTSSLYLAALIFSFVASKMCEKFGRKPTILVASVFFLAGAGLSGGAQNIAMLIVGRIFLGVGVGFGNEAVPLFLSEIAPVQRRGAVNILFQLFVTIGILIANLVNYGTSKMYPNGWRVSLGLASVPAAVLFIGSIFITETPTSLVENGKEEEGYAALKKIRGVSNVDDEFKQIKNACVVAQQVKNPFRSLMKRASVPPLVIGILLQVFQQFTGINAIMFYAPVLFETVGFKNDASLLSSVITGTVNVLSTLVSIYAVDRIGRRKLLLQACIQMFVCMITIGFLLRFELTATGSLTKPIAALIVVLVCLFVMSFAWSWGPLGWLIPSETFPVETRAAGFAFAVSTNMLFTFIIAQAFLSMMCHMRAYIFFFFAAWILVMSVFVVFLLPETKNVPIDLIAQRVWKQHPVWRRFMD